MTWRVLTGDACERLADLPDQSVQTCVTSPPYWGLRDYGTDGQLGLEPTPDAYVQAIVEVFQCVWRVLKDDGTCWLNLGDSYANNSNGSNPSPTSKLGSGPGGASKYRDLCDYAERRIPQGLKAKDLCGIPWRVAFALQADGWYLRSDIIWAKPNPMPESITDRPTKSHEYLFLLAKSERYFYDADAIKERSVNEESHEGRRPRGGDRFTASDPDGFARTRVGFAKLDGQCYPLRNARSVWTIVTQPYAGTHFATFPEALVEPCILAGSRVGDLVLDPFTGSGTTGAVAIRLGRSFVGVELNPAYVALAEKRIGSAAPLFAVESAEVPIAVDPVGEVAERDPTTRDLF